MISESSSELLKTIYDNIISSSKIKSLTLRSISADRNTLAKIISGDNYYICSNSSCISELIDNGYMRYVNNNRYVITAKGAWLVESKYYSLSIENIIEEIDSIKFKSRYSKVSDKNKVVLLMLLSSRSFDSKSVLTPKFDDSLKTENENFINLANSCYEYLINKKIIEKFDISKTSRQKGFSGQLTEKINELPDITNQIFPKAAKQNYYLNVTNDSGLDTESIKFIIKLIFGEIRCDLIEDLLLFLNNEYYSNGIFFHNINDIDNTIDYDQILRKCVEELAGV